MKTHSLLSTALALFLLTFSATEVHAVTLGAAQDADVATGASLENSTFGTGQYISTNFANATSVIGLVEFDVSAFSSGTVQNATLRLFHQFNSTDGVSYDIKRVTSAWDEATVTYSTRPTIDGAVYSSLTINDTLAEVWREWDVTTLVQEWVDGTSTNYGLALFRNPDVSPWPYFRSKDYVEANEGFPELVVTVVPEPTTLGMASLLLIACSAVRCRTSKI